MSDAQESYERAYAQHRETHGPHGARPEPALDARLERIGKLADLGARVLEILAERSALRVSRQHGGVLELHRKLMGEGPAYLMTEGEMRMFQDDEADRVVLQAQTVDIIEHAARSLGLLDNAPTSGDAP